MSMSIEGLKSLVARIGLLSDEYHKDIMTIVKRSSQNVTENNNGTFVDLVTLPESSIAELESFVTTAEIRNNIHVDKHEEEREILDANAVRWDADINSKPVFDKAEELVRRHMFKALDQTVAPPRKRSASKKTFVLNQRRVVVYEPHLNDLDEDM